MCSFLFTFVLMNPEELIHKYCAGNAALEKILLKHSRDVANRALKVVEQHPELIVDKTFLYEAAMLHDIGIVNVDAPGISCFGKEPYIKHGLLGGEILRAEGLPLHARVAERHTGTGLTKEEILRQNLPLPAMDLVPESIEEQIICYADKFYSKSRLDVEKTNDQALHSLMKFGEGGVAVFSKWMELFG